MMTEEFLNYLRYELNRSELTVKRCPIEFLEVEFAVLRRWASEWC